MIIANNSIIIAHMKKSGGTSVCRGMIESLPAGAIDYWGYTAEGEERSAKSRRRGKLWKHSPVSDILHQLPQNREDLKREDLEIYLVSARPWWDRVGSFYFHARRYHNRNAKKYPWVKDMSFSTFIRSDYMHNEVEHLDRFCQDESGQNLVDHFVEYSEIAQWYPAFMEKLGVKGATLPEYNRGRARFSDGYRSIYSDEDFEYLQPLFAGETRLLAQFSPGAGGLLSRR